MGNFDVMTAISDRLRGKDQGVWQEILKRVLKSKNPNNVSIPQAKIIDVVWPENIEPDNLITHLVGKGCVVDEKLVAAFEQEQKSDRFMLQKVLRPYRGQVMIQVDPAIFGIEYDTYQPSIFGINATISYQKVVDAAAELGFKQPDFTTALYFRNRFWDAHRYTEGTRYYIGCKPLVYDTSQLPVIPVLDYDRYQGWFLRAQEIAPDIPLNMNVVSGQGEHLESTFIFVLPQST